MATIAPPRPEQTTEPDAQKLEEFMHKIVGDMAAAMSGSLVITGTKLGLYKGLADIGPATSPELATHLGLDERYVREWLSAQAASGFVDYDSQGERFSLNAEQTNGALERGLARLCRSGIRAYRLDLHRRAQDH